MSNIQKSEDWPPKTIDGIIDAFLACADGVEMDLINEMPKNRIPWLARNLDSLFTNICDFDSVELRDELGDRNMSEKDAKIKVTEIIWKYWNFQ